MRTSSPGDRARTTTAPPSRRYVWGVSTWGLATAAYLGLAGGLPRDLLVGAVAVDTIALDHGSLPAILVGLLPAAPCWLDAIRVGRSRRRA